MTLEQIIENLISSLTPRVRRAFENAIQSVVDSAILKDIIRAIELNDPEAAFRAAGFTPQAMYPLIQEINGTFETGGFATADTFPTYLTGPDGTRFVFRFDMSNPRVEKYLKDHSSQLVTRLTEDARQVVRATLERGYAAGNNPRNTALDIVGRIDPVTKKRTGGVLGLAQNQEMWSANTRRDLENLDPRYFQRSLRDRRFDSIVKKAIESGEKLNEDQVSKLVSAYNNRALKYRADSIARTETIQALNQSEWEAHKQVLETGAVKENDITRHWDSAHDSRVRWSHEAMDKKYRKEGIGLDEPFVSPSGAQMMHPGDTSLGASGDETIMCRCRVKIKVDWFAGL